MKMLIDNLDFTLSEKILDVTIPFLELNIFCQKVDVLFHKILNYYDTIS